MVTTAQLAAIMGGDIDYSQHVAAANEAMQRAQCTTALRQAMFLAQVGHESAGLRYFREIDPGYYLRGRTDLGHGPGEGEQWRGAGPIQLLMGGITILAGAFGMGILMLIGGMIAARLSMD